MGKKGMGFLFYFTHTLELSIKAVNGLNMASIASIGYT